jgi:hypothetical protein
LGKTLSNQNIRALSSSVMATLPSATPEVYIVGIIEQIADTAEVFLRRSVAL